MAINWKVVCIAGIALLLSGVFVGFVSGRTTPQTESAVLSAYIGNTFLHFILYSLVFSWVGYRQRQSQVLHAVLAYLLSLALAIAIMATLYVGLSLSPSEPQPLVLQAIDWVVTICSAAVGLLVGRNVAKFVLRTHAKDDA